MHFCIFHLCCIHDFTRNHWVLSVVNPEAQVVYHLDPLKRRIESPEWMEVVDK